MDEDDELRDTERLIPIREETGLPPPEESQRRVKAFAYVVVEDRQR